MAGLRQARGAHVITMDDDLQNPPGEVLRLLATRRRAARTWSTPAMREKQHASWRNLGSRFTNRVADFVLDKPKGLYLSSFRCMSAFVVQAVTDYDGPFPYVDGLIMQVTQNIGQLEVEHLPRMAGRSNYTLRRLVRLWLNMFVNFSVMPLRLSTLTGFALSLLGIFGFVWVVGEAMLRADAGGLGVAGRGGAAAVGRAAPDPRPHRRISRPALSHHNRKPQAIVREIVRAEPAERAAEPVVTLRKL